jgi:predicted amidohydrolase
MVADPTGDVVAEADADARDAATAGVSTAALERGRELNPVRQTRDGDGVPPWPDE